jgi:uncharacterized SAM-binding protein YcdF (DUF218 family)
LPVSVSRSPRRRVPAGRLRHNRARPRPRNWLLRGGIAAVLLVSALFVWAVIARNLAPTSNTALTRFDAIIVLGYPVDSDGNPTPTQLARVTEAVHEYERGVAPRLIVTGAGVANHFVEAEVMARTAHAQGVPDSAIFVEPAARDTIENACYAARIMKSHGWESAEIVSSASHLPRVALIFSKLPLEWNTHAAPSMSPEADAHLSGVTFVETMKTLRYLTWARWTERCEP